MDNAFKYVQQEGLCSEEDYPYEAKDAKCRADKCTSKINITGFVDIKQGDEKSLLEAVGTIGPVSVAIEADKQTFQFYKTGVYDDPQCGKNLDHGVLAVGYGNDNGQDYWLVKNSWGPLWGDKGYIRMIRDKNQCGIAEASSYPVEKTSL